MDKKCKDMDKKMPMKGDMKANAPKMSSQDRFKAMIAAKSAKPAAKSSKPAPKGKK